MAAAIEMNSRDCFAESVRSPMSAEAKALDFFRRAELSDALEKKDDRHSLAVSAGRPANTEAKALDFFRRADLSDALMSIWEFIKRQRFSTALKMTKAVAMIAAAILLSQSISIGGVLSLIGSIGGLLIAAITSVHAWIVYIPLYFAAPSDFSSSVLLALGLAWLGGITPFVALLFSPFILFGFRLAESAASANTRASDVPSAIAKAVEQTDLGATLQRTAGNVASFFGAMPRRVAKLALLPKHAFTPI